MWSPGTMLHPDSFGLAVVARIADLFADATPWTQRQWRSGSLDALRHVQALVANGGREGAKTWALKQLRISITSDPFISAMERGALLKALSVKPDRLAPGSQGARMLDELESHLADNYWSWATDVCLNLDDSKPVSAVPASAD